MRLLNLLLEVDTMRIIDLSQAQRDAICAFGMPDRYGTVCHLEAVSKLIRKKAPAKMVADLATWIMFGDFTDSDWTKLYHMIKYRKSIALMQATLEWHKEYGYPEQTRPWRYIAKTRMMEYFGNLSVRQTNVALLRIRYLATDPFVKEIAQNLLDDSMVSNWEGYNDYEEFLDCCTDTLPFLREDDDVLYERYQHTLYVQKKGTAYSPLMIAEMKKRVAEYMQLLESKKNK